jgi:hypothetical protein
LIPPPCHITLNKLASRDTSILCRLLNPRKKPFNRFSRIYLDYHLLMRLLWLLRNLNETSHSLL